jgi:hypothetical protein
MIFKTGLSAGLVDSYEFSHPFGIGSEHSPVACRVRPGGSKMVPIFAGGRFASQQYRNILEFLNPG